MGLFDKLFGTRSEREIKRIQPIADKVLALESEYKALSDEALKAKTGEFKARYEKGHSWLLIVHWVQEAMLGFPGELLFKEFETQCGKLKLENI